MHDLESVFVACKLLVGSGPHDLAVNLSTLELISALSHNPLLLPKQTFFRGEAPRTRARVPENYMGRLPKSTSVFKRGAVWSNGAEPAICRKKPHNIRCLPPAAPNVRHLAKVGSWFRTKSRSWPPGINRRCLDALLEASCGNSEAVLVKSPQSCKKCRSGTEWCIHIQKTTCLHRACHLTALLLSYVGLLCKSIAYFIFYAQF